MAEALGLLLQALADIWRGPRGMSARRVAIILLVAIFASALLALIAFTTVL
jgi:hypothetical protein